MSVIKGFDSKLILEQQYQNYLKVVHLDESKMHPIQKKETRLAFYAGFMSSVLATGEIADKVNEDEFGEIMDGVIEYGTDYFKTIGIEYEEMR